MFFNPDITKQAQEVIFSRNSKKTNHPMVYYNQAPVVHTNCHKYLGMYLDKKLNFLQHIKEKISKAHRGIGVIPKLTHKLPRHSLITIFKSFVRPHPIMEAFATKLKEFNTEFNSCNYWFY